MSNFREEADVIFYGEKWIQFTKKFKGIFKEVIKKVDEHNVFVKKIRNKDTLEYIESYRDSPLVKFLNDLSLEEIKIIKTVMYIGRDKDHHPYGTPELIFDRKFKELELNSSNLKSIEINVITEKSPLRSYILDGMEILKII